MVTVQIMKISKKNLNNKNSSQNKFILAILAQAYLKWSVRKVQH